MLDDVKRRRLKLADRGVEIALLDWGGEGPLALLHHANGFCAAVWDGVARELAHHYRVIAMDARGHGDSSTPEGAEAYAWRELGADVAAVARTLAEERGEPVALGLGNSFGGTALMLAEASQPGLFGHLVGVDPVLLPAPDDGVGPPARGKAPQLIEVTRRRSAVFPDRATARAGWAGKPLFAAWQPRALDLYLAEGMADRPDGQVQLKCHPETEAAIFANTPGSGIWERAEEVTAPVLLLWARDGDFPRPVFERMAGLLPRATLEDLAAGHLAPMENPGLVAEAVLGFCGRVEAAQRSTG